MNDTVLYQRLTRNYYKFTCHIFLINICFTNTLSFNELVTLWEGKIGKTLERIYVPEEQLLKQIEG